MPQSLPQYPEDLAGFAGVLRQYLGLSQREVAAIFHLNHSTVARYESEEITPPLGYLASMVRLVLRKYQRTTKHHPIKEAQRFLLQAINQAIEHNYQDEPDFQSWGELAQIADEYIAKRQSTHQPADQDSRTLQPQTAPSNQNLKATPTELPPLPHFYVERQAIQDVLREKVIQERVNTLVIWGPGGSGKSTLALWLAQNLVADFPDGQIWVELSADLEPDAVIREAQRHIARRVGVSLSSSTLSERAGQLRTLLHNKRCLLILDDVWQTAGLAHLQVLSRESCVLTTTRYRKVADVLETPFIEIEGMTVDEGLSLLTKWAGYSIKTGELVNRLGGLPVALKLSGVRLRDGDRPDELLAYFQAQNIDLNRLSLDNPQAVMESLTHCFERSFDTLISQEQLYFAQLGCFVGKFDATACAAIWHLPLDEAQRQLMRFDTLALAERVAADYRLHPLLRDYARQKLSTLPKENLLTDRRHAAYYIRHYLYHPQVLDDITHEAPPLDENWGDVVSGVKWAVQNEPQLATIAALLAHTERSALLEAVGSSMTTAVEAYLSQTTSSETNQAILHELLGDLHLLGDNSETALIHFDQAAIRWRSHQHHLASSRARLRLAGIYLLRQDKSATVESLSQAQAELASALPITESDLEIARWLFYWFDLIYTGCVKWGDAALLEKPATEFLTLAQKTNESRLEARGWHIYQLLHTASEIARPEAERRQGRHFAARAAWLWWRHGERDKALTEVLWTQERTSKHRSYRRMRHFARRLSQATPNLSQEQINLLPNDSVRRWLRMSEDERVTWLVNELPSGEEDWVLFDDILSIGTMGEQARRLAGGLPRPREHIVSEPIWKLLTGQRPIPLVGSVAVAFVKHYLSVLETELS